MVVVASGDLYEPGHSDAGSFTEYHHVPVWIDAEEFPYHLSGILQRLCHDLRFCGVAPAGVVTERSLQVHGGLKHGHEHRLCGRQIEIRYWDAPSVPAGLQVDDIRPQVGSADEIAEM